MSLRAVPLAFPEAQAFVRELHRHHTPPAGHKFSIAATDTQVNKLVSALEGVRACRLPPQKGVQTIHGVVDMETAWNVSGLTKLLPQIDAALDGKGEKA